VLLSLDTGCSTTDIVRDFGVFALVIVRGEALNLATPETSLRDEVHKPHISFTTRNALGKPKGGHFRSSCESGCGKAIAAGVKGCAARCDDVTGKVMAKPNTAQLPQVRKAGKSSRQGEGPRPPARSLRNRTSASR
jgi:hypothetical protein